MFRSARAVIVAVIAAVAIGLPQVVLAPGDEYAPTMPARSGAVDGLEGTPPPPRPSDPPAAATQQPPTGPVVSPALEPGAVNRSSYDLSVTYDVGVTLHYGDRLLAVDSLMTITNTSGASIDRLELNTIAARLGGITITAASVAGHAVKVTVDDQTLVMPLGGVLAAGSTVQARLLYRAHLRSDLASSNWMFTRVNGIVDAYRWLPWVSRRVPFNRPNHGDPFITPVSPRVRVRITTDRSLVFATTGDRVAASGLTQTFEAANVRDFTITASPDYRTGSVVVGSTTVRVYYRPGGPGSAMLAAARAALPKIAALVGAYPYRTFKVVQSSGSYGMESPGLIWIPTGAPSANLPYLVYHETAHQWFYGLVGSNQAYEPFTDEAVTDFVARYALGMRRASRCATAELDLSIYRYSSACYYEVVYIQGGNFLEDLRQRMGASAFWKALRGYVAANRYGITTTKQLLDALDAGTTLDLRPRYAPRFPRIY